MAAFYLFRWQAITKMIFQMQTQNYAGIRPHMEVHSSAKDARISLAAFWIFTEPHERRTQFRVIHLVMVVGGTAKF